MLFVTCNGNRSYSNQRLFFLDFINILHNVSYNIHMKKYFSNISVSSLMCDIQITFINNNIYCFYISANYMQRYDQMRFFFHRFPDVHYSCMYDFMIWFVLLPNTPICSLILLNKYWQRHCVPATKCLGRKNEVRWKWPSFADAFLWGKTPPNRKGILIKNEALWQLVLSSRKTIRSDENEIQLTHSNLESIETNTDKDVFIHQGDNYLFSLTKIHRIEKDSEIKGQANSMVQDGHRRGQLQDWVFVFSLGSYSHRERTGHLVVSIQLPCTHSYLCFDHKLGCLRWPHRWCYTTFVDLRSHRSKMEHQQSTASVLFIVWYFQCPCFDVAPDGD